MIVMKMTWPALTSDLYDRVRAIVRWEEEPAPGGVLHVAGFDERGMHVVDVWESAEQFNAFVQSRLMPGIAQIGDHGEPAVEIIPVHALFIPAAQPG